MTLPCPVPRCDRVMPGHLPVCRACRARLLRDLADVPALEADLDIALTRQARIGDRDAGQATETPLAWDQRAREASDILRSALVGWHRTLAAGAPVVSGPVCLACEHPSCEWADLGRTPPDTLAGLSLWLLRHRVRLLRHPAVAEAVDELRAAIGQARAAIDRPADRIYAGPCEGCDRDLYARPGAETVTCWACTDDHGEALRYDVTARRDWMLDEVQEMVGTSVWVANVATALGYRVSPSTVRTWGMRGRITPRTYGPPLNPGADPHPLYRVGDVIDRVRQRMSL